MSASRSRSRAGTPVVVPGLFLLILLLGLGLRLAFLLVSHPHVDEYSSMWAAQQVLQKGVPLLPSGFIYLQGVLFTYVEALFIGLLGSGEVAARLPSLVFSVLLLVVVFAWGRRSFGVWGGLGAMALAALEPEAIVWGGRARMYALQHLLVVVALYGLYRGYVDVEPDRRAGRWRWISALAFLGAVLSHVGSVLVLPAVGVCVLVWRRRWLGLKQTWPPLLVYGLSLVLAVFLNRIGGPVSEVAGRDFLDPALPWRLKPEFFFREFLWGWPALIKTLLFLTGFALMLRAGWRAARGKADGCGGEGRPWTTSVYLLAALSASLAPMFFLVGESWQRPRYLTMILPLFDLLAAGIVCHVWTSAGPRLGRGRRWLGPALVAVLLPVLFGPAALGVIGPVEAAYDDAFAYVRAHWQEGDAVVGPLPSIAGVYLGRCDGYMLQNGYEEYLVEKEGVAVDRWTGAPLIDSVADFESRFGLGRRVWFVIDDQRWELRYTPEFREYLLRQMSVEYEVHGVVVYRRAARPGRADAGVR